MASRRLDQSERAIWRAAMRDVKPLGGSTVSSEGLPTPAIEPSRPARNPPLPQAKLTERSSPLLTHQTTPGLDRRNAERLKRGQLRIEARLDLHGLTQEEAHEALGSFVARSHEAGRRCVLVITGKSGVLRAAVPRWLNERPLRTRLIAFTSAQPRDGGTGALYVLLRRSRRREGVFAQ